MRPTRLPMVSQSRKLPDRIQAPQTTQAAMFMFSLFFSLNFGQSVRSLGRYGFAALFIGLFSRRR